jgi:hypothetical protein
MTLDKLPNASGNEALKAEVRHLLEGIYTAPHERAPNGARTGALASYGIEGTVGGLTAGTVVAVGEMKALSSPLSLGAVGEATKAGLGDMGSGLLKGGLAAGAGSGLDMLLQREFGHNIGGHDLFRPTGLEMLGLGAAAAVPMDLRVRAAVAGVSWLAGRVENYFDA